MNKTKYSRQQVQAVEKVMYYVKNKNVVNVNETSSDKCDAYIFAPTPVLNMLLVT